MKSNVYQESKDDQAPLCRAQYRGCTKFAMVRIPCQREGTECYACTACLQTWRARCQLDASLNSRCPVCAALEIQRTTGAAVAAAPALPLQGPAAVAIMEAMRLEGINLDSRNRVLIRLRRDLAPWLHRDDQETDANAVMVHA